MLASPLYGQNRQDCKTSRIPMAPEKPAAMVQERGASAKRTQSDHSRRESLMSNSSQEPRASGKPDAVFSSKSDEPGNQFESSIFFLCRVPFFNVLIYQNWEDLFLKVNKDHLLSQARSELMKQEYQVGSLTWCINELQQHAYGQRLELQDAHHGYIESRREQARLQKELIIYEGKASLRYSKKKYS